jgi:hypothetical protein
MLDLSGQILSTGNTGKQGRELWMICFGHSSMLAENGSTERSASSQQQAEQDTTDATGDDRKEEESEMDPIGRVDPDRVMKRIFHVGELEEAVDEEKAPQVHQAIQIQRHFKPLLSPCAFAHQRQEASQIGENRKNQEKAQRLPAGNERGNSAQGGIIRIGIRKREEPEDQQLTQQTKESHAGQTNLFELALSCGSTQWLGPLALHALLF